MEPKTSYTPEDVARLIRVLGSPWGVDQDCKFCGSHYLGHREDCPWAAVVPPEARGDIPSYLEWETSNQDSESA